MSEIHRLVYYSRNRLAGAPDKILAEIRAILAKSQSNNSRVGVTGALMFNAGCFAQVLEGPQDAVESTFERIQQDERHGDVTLLGFGPVPERAFAGWSMAFIGASEHDAARYSTIAGESGFEPSRLDSDALFGILHQMVQEEERPTAIAS